MPPKICEFAGLHIYIFNRIGVKHHYPHVHVKAGEWKAVYKIESAQLIAGSMPFTKEKFIKDLIVKREKELYELWSDLNKTNVTITV